MQRSAMGKAVDMSALVSKNEKVRAVGNMKVNARGDIIDSHNRIVQENTQRVQTTYTNTVTEQTLPVENDTLSQNEQSLFEEADEDLEE